MTTYTARWVFPVSGPPVERGVVAVDGERIVPAQGKADVDFGEVAIIPGLVNAHTHLDLSGARGLIPPTDPEHFTDWLLGVIAYRRSRTPEQVQGDIADGLAECLKSGTTLVGNIAVEDQSKDALAAAPIRSRTYFEIITLNPRQFHSAVGKVMMSNSVDDESKPHRFGVSPHSPYTVCGAFFQCDVKLLHQYSAIHFAEWDCEAELLRSHAGPLQVFLEKLKVWHPEAYTLDHTALLKALEGKHYPLLVHCNYLPADTLIRPRQSIAICPRTHAAFHHPRHPFAEFLARGVNVALGTDSLASNPDLDLFEEARFLFEHRKDVSSETILKMATLNGAKALGFESDCGSLEPGKSADFVVMPLGCSSDPYEALFTGRGPRRTLFRGAWRD